MNILDRIRSYLRRDLSWTNPKSWDSTLWNLAGSQSLSGEIVNEYTALNYSAVYNAVSLISGTIGSLPLHLMQKKDHTKRLADNRVMYRLMHDEWNPYMSAMAGREILMSHVLTWGNGYAEKVTNGYGEVIQLWPITPNRVTPEMRESQLVYRIHMDGEQDRIFSREKILHIPGLGFDGFLGYSVVGMARKSIGLGMAMETFGSLYFGAGTHPGAIVEHPAKLSQAAHDNLKKSLTEAHSGLGQSHRLLLLEEGMKMQTVGIPPNDAQFLESRQFQIPEIARWFNLPPHKLKDLTKSSFSNIESEQISFVTDSILPWLVRLEQNYNMQILSKSDKDLSGYGRLYFKHSVEGLLRSDAKSRAEFYSKMFNVGVFSVNEIRAFEDLDPIDGGDIHLVPMNMVSLEYAGEKPTVPSKFPKEIPEPKPEEEPEPKELIGDGNGNKE